MTRLARLLVLTAGFLAGGLPAPVAWAAWGSVGSLGSVQDKTANKSSMALATAAQLDAGRIGVLCVAVDNNQTTDGDEGAVSGVVDDAGNSWTKAAEFTNGQAGAQAGATASLWYVKAGATLSAGANIMISFTNNTSRDASAATAWAFTVGAGGGATVQTSTTLAVDNADPSSMNLSPPSAEYLWVRCIAGETNSTTALTPTANFTALGGNQTAGGQAATNMAVRGEFRIFTGTSNASDPTWANSDNANVYAALAETAPPAAACPATAGLLVEVAC